MKKNYLFIAGFALILAVLACCPPTTPPEPQATSASIEEQATEPVATPEPTNTLISPTDAPEPTATYTPEPTATPIPPTATLPPTPIPEIMILEGSGDSIVDVDEHNASVIHVTGNAEGRHFSVTSYDSNNDMIDVLVNTTDPYDGFVPLDWLDDEDTTRFEINSNGNWVIEIIPLAPIPEIQEHFLTVPGSYEGNGDDVIILQGNTPDLVIITGNEESRYFGVFGWGRSGKDILVNTTDSYNGTVMLDSESFAITVTADGSWTIEVTEK